MEIGIDLGGTNMRVALVKDGIILHKETTACPSLADEQEVLRCLEELIARTICAEVSRIGIGVPSIVDTQEGIVYNVANIPSWKEVPLKRLLESRFAIPVCVNNDANCFALGVKCFGEGRNYHHLVGLTIGTGIGAGVVIHDKLYAGNNTGAGEVGSLPYMEHDFEYYASSNFFVRQGTSGRELSQKAARGDAGALRLWTEFGKHLGELMKAILFVYDPQAVFIGGGIAEAFPFYEPAMRTSLQSFPYSETVKRVNIAISNVADAALLGASVLVNGQ